MRIAIVGCGYVGGWAGRRMLAGHPELGAVQWVRGSTTTASRLREIQASGIEAHCVQLDEPQTLSRFLEDATHVLLSFAAGRRGGYREIYVDGMRAVLDVFSPQRLPHVVYTSSTGVYGADDGSWVDEQTAPRPASENARALAEAEQLLLDEGRRRGFRASVLRLSGIVGPGRGPQRMAERWAGQKRDDGQSWLNLVHVDDVVEAICRVMGRAAEGVFNVSSAEPLRRGEFYDRTLKSRSLPPIHWQAGAAVGGKRVGIRKLREELGLEPRRIDPAQL